MIRLGQKVTLTVIQIVAEVLHKISVLRQQLVIIFATRAEAKSGGAFRQKLVIICATRVGANLGVLAFKISVLRQKVVIICATRAGANLRVLVLKISVLR